MTETLPTAVKSSLEVTTKDVVKLLTNSNVSYGTKGSKIEKIKQALAERVQLRASILVNGNGDEDLLAAFDLLFGRLSAPAYFTARDYTAVKASEDFKSLADILARYRKKVRKSRDPAAVQAIIDPFVDLIKEAYDTLASTKSTEFKNMLVRRTPLEMQRGHLGENGSLPTIPEHLVCIFCKHESIDEPATNLHIRRRNNLKRVGYDEQLAAYNLALSNGVPPLTKEGKAMTKSPPTPTYEDEVCHCHCSTTFCVSGTQGNCKLCLNANAQQLDKDGICQCKVCLCPCAKACKVRLMLLLFISIIAN